MERPRGITVIAILEIIFGTLGIIGSIIALFSQSLFMSLGFKLGNDVLRVIISLTGITLSTLAIIAGIGLIKLKKWGRFLVMTVAWFSILQTLINQIFTIVEFEVYISIGSAIAILGIIYNSVIFFYLKQKKHHHLFDLASEETNKIMEGELDKLAQQPVPPQPPTQ